MKQPLHRLDRTIASSATEHERRSTIMNPAASYLAEVSNVLCDLPTPAINAAVMRGAGVHMSSAADNLPGPRRIVLNTLVAARSVATGSTGVSILERQRRNFGYLEAQRLALAEQEHRRAGDVLGGLVQEREDHVAGVLEILATAPVLPADFMTAFARLAEMAGLEPDGSDWRIMTSHGAWTGKVLGDLGRDFRFESLKARAEANADRFRRWRAALARSVSGSSAPATGPARLGVARPGTVPNPTITEPPAVATVDRVVQEPARRHHEEQLASDEIAERRRRFPELFYGIASSRAGEVSATEVAERRRRFPELFDGRGSAALTRNEREDGLELG
jgi:hypothetical protein